MPRWTARRCECAGPFVLSHLHPTPVGIIQEVPVTETIYTLSLHACAEGDILPKDAVLITPEGASFKGGNQTFTLSPTNEQQVEDETSQEPQLAQNVPSGNPNDIAALQQAILGGADILAHPGLISDDEIAFTGPLYAWVDVTRYSAPR